MNLEIDSRSIMTIECSFERIASHIFNEVLLFVNNSCFKIVDIEFYYCLIGKHEDGYTMKHEKNIAELNGHKYGVDVSLGSAENEYGGILIKGAFNSKGEYLNKSRFRKELINGLKIGSNKIGWKVELYSNDDLISIKRENLGKPIGEGKSEGFKNARYRFIKKNKDVFKHLKNKETIIKCANINNDEQKALLGYNLKN